MSATLAEIDACIRNRHAAGASPGNITNYLRGSRKWPGVVVADVHHRMKVMGIDVPPAREVMFPVARMWELEGDDLRDAIWKRQRAGAKAALRRGHLVLPQAAKSAEYAGVRDA